MPKVGEHGRNPTSAIIHSLRAFFHLPEAIRLFPESPVVVRVRMSSYSNAGGKGLPKLEARSYMIGDEVCRLAPGKLRRYIRRVDCGRLTDKDYVRHLVEDIEAALTYGRNPILVDLDTSRWLHAQEYCRQDERRDLEPSREELDQFFDFGRGKVVFATYLDPKLTEAERHSWRTKNAQGVGAPRKLTPELAADIAEALGQFYIWETHSRTGPFSRLQRRFEVRIEDVANQFHVGKATVERALDMRSPDGRTWRDVKLQEWFDLAELLERRKAEERARRRY